MEEFRQKTISALTWSGAIQSSQYGFQFLISVVLARLLTPVDFGLIGMVMVLTGFAARFSDLGMGAALVQKLEVTEEQTDSVFWINIMIGAGLTALFMLTAPLIAWFYKEPGLVSLTRVLALIFIFHAFGNVHRVVLQRRLDFKRIAQVEVSALLLGGVLAIGMALMGFGVWSLVAQPLVNGLTTSILFWLLVDWRPEFRFRPGKIKELTSFAFHLMGFDFFNYWVRQFDNILIGWKLGSAPLGLYSRAYNLMVFPVSRLGGLISRVMFPALSAIQEDRQRVKRVYLQVTRGIALITFPLMVGMLVVADNFMLTVFGRQWMGAVPVLELLCVAGLFQSIGTTVGWIYTSQGRTDIMFKWGVAAGVVRITSFVIGVHWGIVGVAAAVVISGLVLWIPSWIIPGRLIELRFGEMAKNVLPLFLSAVVMGLFVTAISVVIPGDWPVAVVLLVQILAGVASYAALVHVFGVQAYIEVREVVVSKLKSKRAVKVGG
jgi:PST family polysaccharide transporter